MGNREDINNNKKIIATDTLYKPMRNSLVMFLLMPGIIRIMLLCESSLRYIPRVIVTPQYCISQQQEVFLLISKDNIGV